MGLSLAELALLTMADFDALCRAWVGEESGTSNVRWATQADLNKIFPR